MADITWTWQSTDETKVRYVRTQGGVRRYDQPIGSPILSEGGARSALKLKPGRALNGERRKPTSVGDLKPGDEVVTHGSGVGRALKASGPSAGEVRRVASVEDGEEQFGPSGKGKTVIRFEDGSFSTPSAGKWDVVTSDAGLTDVGSRVQTTDMNTTQTTETAITFDEVRIGDTVAFDVTFRDRNNIEIQKGGGVVVKKTGKQVIIEEVRNGVVVERNAISAARWYSKNVRRIGTTA